MFKAFHNVPDSYAWLMCPADMTPVPDSLFI